jgi:hypothetical protein
MELTELMELLSPHYHLHATFPPACFGPGSVSVATTKNLLDTMRG